MGARLSQLSAPVLLFLAEENNTAFPFAGEFKKIAPQWEVARVHERLSAMRHFVADAPQAFVMDLAILDEGGVELIEWIKAQPQFRFLPIVVLASSDGSSHRQRCAALGVSSYLDKPKSFKELRNNIRYIVKLCEGPRFDSPEWKEMSCA
jgi:CheY-like chemotaxis protein